MTTTNIKEILNIIMLFNIIPVIACASTSIEHIYINGDSSYVSDIELNSNGDVYINVIAQGIYKYTKSGWTQLDVKAASDISFDADDNLWALRKGIFSRYKEGIWTDYNFNYSLYPCLSFEASKEKGNALWCIPFNESGIRLFDYNSTTIKNYNKTNCLKNDFCNIIRTTNDGQVWLSHTNIDFCERCTYDGVSHFKNGKWEYYTVENGLPDIEVRAIEPISSEEVFIGSNMGIAKYDGSKLTHFSGYRTITMAKGMDGALWAAIWKGNIQYYVRYYDNNEYLYERNDRYPPTQIKIDKNQTIWSCNSGQLFKINIGNPLTVNNTNEEILPIISVFPNPCNPITNISFCIEKEAIVQLDIYNISGQKIKTLINGILHEGHYSYQWNCSDHANGVYISRLTVNHRSHIAKICIIH